MLVQTLYGDACTKTYPNKCISSKSVRFAPSSVKEEAQSVVTPSSIPTVAVDKHTEELNKKINTLQTEVEDSKKRQNVLEQTVANLLTFIRNIFPTFKSK